MKKIIVRDSTGSDHQHPICKCVQLGLREHDGGGDRIVWGRDSPRGANYINIITIPECPSANQVISYKRK